MTSVATPAAPAAPEALVHGRRTSKVGLAVTVVLLALSALLALPCLWLAMEAEPAGDYGGGAFIVFACMIVGGSLFFCGAVAGALTLWPERRRLYNAMLVAAALPWVAVGVASLPFLVEVCSRNGGACG